MLISHETPIELLNVFARINDYDYALVHLFEYPEYREFFERSLKRGRKVYLDNSIFELGKSFDIEKYSKLAIELYDMGGDLTVIAPDVWNNSKETIENFNKFKKKMPSRMRIMGVLQGRTTEELMECYDGLVKADIIGINHMSQAFGDFKFSFDEFNDIVENRIKFVNLLKNSKRLHILGLLHISEISEYSLLNNVYSLDTSFPVCLGLEYKSITEPLSRKPLWNLEQWRLERGKMDPVQIALSVLNAKLLKQLVL